MESWALQTFDFASPTTMVVARESFALPSQKLCAIWTYPAHFFKAQNLLISVVTKRAGILFFLLIEMPLRAFAFFARFDRNLCAYLVRKFGPTERSMRKTNTLRNFLPQKSLFFFQLESWLERGWSRRHKNLGSDTNCLQGSSYPSLFLCFQRSLYSSRTRQRPS